MLDNIGLPALDYNLAFTDGTTIGVNDGEILLQLKEGHRQTADYVRALRRELPSAFPDTLFYFQPADQVTQILNFGVASQIDVQVVGIDRSGNQKIAAELSRRLAGIPGLVDVHVQQELDAPQLYYTVDRTRAQELGLTVSQVTNNLNISLSSSKQVTPNFWTDPKTGIPYYLTVQTPEYRIQNVGDLDETPITSASGDVTPVPGLFGNVASFKRIAVQSVFNQTNIQSVYDVYGSVQDRDLGAVSKQIQKVIGELQPKMPGGNRIVVSGQIQSMNGAFANLTLGLLFAAVFVYMLMVVNYQSFVDPLAVILALPGAGCGIILMLYVTGTTFSVPSLMGAIMSVGVASANSILLVTFAREQREKGMSAADAAQAAGITRLRPVLMTAAAMMFGMLPMAIGGPGEELNAVLARAVIGGTLVGTITTLLFVPYLYSVFGRFNRVAASAPGTARQQGQPT
jgi:multidrug efflux pump subunit AcrB